MQKKQSSLIAVLVEKISSSFSGYDLVTGERLFSARLPDYPHEFTVSNDGKHAYVGHYGVETSMHHGSGGHRVCIIDIERGEYIGDLECSPFNRIHGIRTDEKNRVYVLSEQENVLLVYENPLEGELPDRAVHIGGVKAHLFVLSKSGERAYVTNLLSHNVTLVHPYDASIAPISASVGMKPEGCCLSKDESFLYVTSRIENTLYQIDAVSMKVLKVAPTGEDPTRIYLSHDNRLFVTNYGEKSITIYDPDSLKELGKVSTVHKPIAMSFHPDNHNLAYIPLNNHTVAKLEIDHLALTHAFNTGLEPDGLIIVSR